MPLMTGSRWFAEMLEGYCVTHLFYLPARTAVLPNLPAAAGAGLPPFTAGAWAALFGPAQLPPEITQRMNPESGRTSGCRVK